MTDGTHRYAPSALWRKRRYYAGTLLRAAGRGAAPALAAFERLWFRPRDASPDLPFPVFIVGVPRSGSTLLYQAVTERFDVAYPDNLAAAFVRTPATGMAFSAWRYGRRPHGCFRSRLGNTLACGFHAPAECGGLWDALLGSSGPDGDYEGLPSDRYRRVERYLNGILVRCGRPVVFKNLRTGQMLSVLRRVAPAARVIRIRRDPAACVASVLKARHTAGTPDNAAFGTVPPGFRDDPGLPMEERVVRQVVALERGIDAGIGAFDPARVLDVRYDDLLDGVEAVLERVGAFFGNGAGLRPGSAAPRIRRPAAADDPARMSGIRTALAKVRGA